MDGTNGYTPIEQAMSDTELNTSASNASLTSMSTAKSLPSESEVGTPPTSHGTPEVEVVEDRVMRYREGLYAYTVSLGTSSSESSDPSARGGRYEDEALQLGGGRLKPTVVNEARDRGAD